MKNLFRFLAVGTLATIAWTTQAQEAKITGYEPTRSIVTDKIEQQLDANVVTPIQSALAQKPNSEVSISVIGYADRIGSEGSNDRIGRERAEDVKNFLSEKFPKATITFRSKGDEQNSRMVDVLWKVVIVVAPVPQQKSRVTGTDIVAAVGAVLLIIVLFTRRAVSASKATAQKNEPQPIQQVQPAVDATPAPAEPEIKMVSGEQNGRRLLAPITFEDGVWKTVFLTQERPEEEHKPVGILYRKSPGDAMRATRACMENPYYKTAIEQLIAQGTIKVQKEKSHEEVPELQR
jgi:hypothetical protein